MTLRNCSLYIVLCFLVACGSTDPPVAEASLLPDNQMNAAPPVAIQVELVVYGTFERRSLSTGTVVAQRKADIKLRVGGELLTVPLRERVYIEKGDLLYAVDTRAAELELMRLRHALDEIEFRVKDLIIRNDDDPDSLQHISPERLRNFRIKEGYFTAQQAIRQLEFEVSQARYYAPFGGIVADLKLKPHQQAGAGELLCTLVDANSYEVEFLLLESEALRARKGQAVTVQPIATPGRELRARIVSINPQVSEQGLVRVRAAISGSTRRLYEGMNVRTALITSVPDLYIVPKSAVVYRSDRAVVFTHDAESGLAKWKYVTVAHENDTHIGIFEGLEKGDTIIVSGNGQLDHDAAVVIER